MPGILIAVVGSTIVSAALDLAARSGIAVVGPLPVGLPPLSLPPLVPSDILAVAPAAFGIALVAATDTSILSRSFSSRRGEEVDQDRELLALGGANLATGLFTGMPVSSSSSRTPVAEAAGAQTQMTSVVAAVAIGVGLVAAPGLLADLPTATLAAVVIAAGLSLVDVGSDRAPVAHRVVRVLARPRELPRASRSSASSRASSSRSPCRSSPSSGGRGGRTTPCSAGPTGSRATTT